MKTLDYILAVSLLVLCSCDKKGASEKATEHFLKFEVVYQSEDVREAEKALLEYRQDTIDARQQGRKGIDFEQALAIADARLFLVYETIGDTNKSERFFRNSVEAFKRSAASKGHEPPEFNHAKLRALIDKFDQGLEVKWKRPHDQLNGTDTVPPRTGE